MQFGLLRRPEIGNMRLFREIRNIIPEKKNMALGILYYRNPAIPGQIELLAEIRGEIALREKDLKLPGGHVEKTDPTWKDAFLREFQEEAGISLNPDSLQTLSHVQQTYVSRRDKKIHLRAQAFALELPEKIVFTPMPNEHDIAGYKWVSVEEFKERVRRPIYRESIDGWIAEIQER